jgi:hypothetical protein
VKKSIFPFEFWDSKICRNDHRSLKLDVTFHVDSFSYKNFLIRRRMQKLSPFFYDIKFFCKIYQKSSLLFFLSSRTHNIWKSWSFLFFWFFLSFSTIFHKPKRPPKGGGGVVAGKRCHYPWCIRQGAPGVATLSPGHKASVRRWYFLNSNFIFKILNYYPRRTGYQFASDIPLIPGASLVYSPGVTVNMGRPSRGGPGWSYHRRITDICAGGKWVITGKVDKMRRR